MVNLYSLCMQTGGGMQLGANINGYGGSLDLNISVLENSDNRNFRNTSRGKNISIGSEDIPMPISLVFRNISEALNLEYWTVSLQNQNGVTYKSLGIARKQLNLVRALEDYPDYEGAKELKGSNMTYLAINITDRFSHSL